MNYERWEAILKKEVNVDHIEEGTRLWFEYVQNFTESTESLEWTTKEYVDSWRQMSESKSSFPGICAAHIKCLTASSKTADIVSKLALIPLITGYAPTAWKKWIACMIPKK